MTQYKIKDGYTPTKSAGPKFVAGQHVTHKEWRTTGHSMRDNLGTIVGCVSTTYGYVYDIKCEYGIYKANEGDLRKVDYKKLGEDLLVVYRGINIWEHECVRPMGGISREECLKGFVSEIISHPTFNEFHIVFKVDTAHGRRGFVDQPYIRLLGIYPEKGCKSHILKEYE